MVFGNVVPYAICELSTYVGIVEIGPFSGEGFSLIRGSAIAILNGNWLHSFRINNIICFITLQHSFFYISLLIRSGIL
jgi:hypothetical protein